MGRRGWVAVAVVTVLGVAATYVVVSRRGATDTAEAAVETAIVERTTLRRTVGGTGTLVAGTERSASFVGGGQVAEVLVDEGQGVTPGDPLAVLDTRSLEADLSSAEAGLTSATSGLDAARTQLAEVESGAAEGEIEIARLQVAQAKDKRWGSQAQRDGVCGRVEAKRGEQYECDNSNAGVLQAEDSVRLAELELELILAGPGDDELASARDRVVQAEAGVETARVKVTQAALKLEQATLTSPITGTVTAVDIAVGELAGSAAAAVVISDLDALEVEISLDETDIAGVEVDDEAAVVLDAFPDVEISGRVVRIAPVAEIQSGVVLFPVTVELDDAGPDVRPGMTADVEIVTASVADALVVPLRAVTTSPQGSIVMRVGTSAGGPAADSRSGPAWGAGGPPRMPTGGAGAGAGARTFGSRAFRQGESGAVSPGALGARALATQWLDGAEAAPVAVEIGLTTETEAEVLSGLAEGDIVLVPQRSSTEGGSGIGGPGMPMGVFRGP